jgi:hypothetical protein
MFAHSAANERASRPRSKYSGSENGWAGSGRWSGLSEEQKRGEPNGAPGVEAFGGERDGNRGGGGGGRRTRKKNEKEQEDKRRGEGTREAVAQSRTGHR